MGGPPILTSAEVRTIARDGRVRADPAYHGHEHALRFEELALALQWCLRVEPDRRLGEAGRPLHPNGYVSFCQRPTRSILRIDFNLDRRVDGAWILIVTGWEVR